MSIVPVNVRFEHHPTGLGVGTSAPRISWYLEGDGSLQPVAYEVEQQRPAGGPLDAARAPSGGDGAQPDGAGGPTTTVTVEPYAQLYVPWPFVPLQSRESATVRVRAGWNGGWTPWSEPVLVEAALLSPGDWSAKFVSPRDIGAIGEPAPWVQGSFVVDGEVAKARLYTTALGAYQAYLNGNRVGDHILAPGWTSYDKRVAYQVYDIGPLLAKGRNFLRALLGNGWYRGRLTWSGRRALYGERLAYLAQVEITYQDGRVERFVSDESWEAAQSGVLADDIYDGQTTDLRLAEPTGPWGPVEAIERDLAVLFPEEAPPVRALMALPELRRETSPSGKRVIDFGQNLVGWVRLRVKGAHPGQQVVVRHAEVLEAGELATRPLRSAKATDRYVLAGEATEVLEPAFTFHGFRYAEVDGVTEGQLEAVEAVVVGSDLMRTGWFESSSPELNRLHENALWSMRGNFLSVPTDCPQRDERLGWTGDIQVFSPAAVTLAQCAGFLASWLTDLALEQHADGAVPHVVPDVTPWRSSAAAWGDAACVVPWVLYQRYGDVEILERQWESMRAWVDHVASQAGPSRLWRGRLQYGDWLDPTAPPEAPYKAQASPDLVATACFARSAGIAARAAGLLGEQEEAESYEALAGEVRRAFAEAYVTPGGLLTSDAQTAYSLALAWDLLPTEQQADGAGRRLAELVRLAGHRIGTGFVGTPWVLDALAGAGFGEDAYRLLFQKRCPSWLYAVSMGATTIWERWDSMLPDGCVNPGQMTSFNHYAFGAVADFLHRRVAGLAPREAGCRSLWVRPLPGRQLTWARSRQLTPYGFAEVAWRRVGGRFELDLTVPQLVEAHVCLPGQSAPTVVGPGQHHFEAPDPVTEGGRLGKDAIVFDLLGDEDAWATFLGAYSQLTGADEDAALEALGRMPCTPLAELAGAQVGPGNSALGPDASAALGAALARLIRAAHATPGDGS